MRELHAERLYAPRLDTPFRRGLYAPPGTPATRFESGNQLLASLRPPAMARLELRRRIVRDRDVLFHAERELEDVFFPEPGTLISLVHGGAEGSELEIGAAGSEGFAGISALYGMTGANTSAVVLSGGAVFRVNAAKLRAELANDHRTRAILMSYAALFLEHMTQGIVCNRIHSIEQRLAKSLLLMRARSGSDKIRISHDLLSRLMGSQRSGVTLAVAALTASTLIRHARQLIVITDPRGLAERACCCYRLMTGKLDDYRARLQTM
jgi:CRP-like cAMP-binding protein